MSRLCLLAVTAPLLLAVPAVAQKPPTALATIEKEVEAARIKYKIPGLSLAIVQGGNIVYTKGFGLRDVAKKLPATPDTLYCIGSSTKAFTAATVLMAADTGTLALTDSPRKLLPYFKLHDPEANAKITIADLLCHRSGLPRTDFLMLASEGTLNRPQLIEAVSAAKPTAPLGKAFQYQNIMFAAAGEIAGVAFGKPYEAVVEERIFKKLGMTRSTLSVAKALKDKDHAVGYDPTSLKPLAWRSIEATAPAGAINSSVREMALWVSEFLNGAPRLLKPASFAAMTHEQMKMSPAMGYGYGWFLHPWNGLRVVEHGGNIDGFNAEIAFLPEKKLGFAMLSNVSASPMAAEIQEIVWRNLSGVKPAPAAKVAPTGKPEVATETEAGSYTAKTAPMTAKVTFEKDHLVLSVPGQPPYAMQFVSGRTYRLAPPLPEGFKATFTADGMKWEQPGVKLEMVKDQANTFQAPLTVEELLAKMVVAAGGEENLQRHQNRVASIRVDFENQGMVGTGSEYADASGKKASHFTLTALGKKIGSIAGGFDGTQTWQKLSFITVPPSAKSERDRAESDFFDGLLEPKRLFETLAITGKESVKEPFLGAEPVECLILKKTLKSGESITEAVSTQTWRVVRRDASDTQLLTDYRETDGVWLPWRTLQKNPAMGAVVTTVESLRWNTPIDPKVYARSK